MVVEQKALITSWQDRYYAPVVSKAPSVDLHVDTAQIIRVRGIVGRIPPATAHDELIVVIGVIARIADEKDIVAERRSISVAFLDSGPPEVSEKGSGTGSRVDAAAGQRERGVAQRGV